MMGREGLFGMRGVGIRGFWWNYMWKNIGMCVVLAAAADLFISILIGNTGPKEAVAVFLVFLLGLTSIILLVFINTGYKIYGPMLVGLGSTRREQLAGITLSQAGIAIFFLITSWLLWLWTAHMGIRGDLRLCELLMPLFAFLLMSVGLGELLTYLNMKSGWFGRIFWTILFGVIGGCCGLFTSMTAHGGLGKMLKMMERLFSVWSVLLVCGIVLCAAGRLLIWRYLKNMEVR